MVHGIYLFSIVGESGGVTVGSRGLITAGATPGSVVVKAALQEEGGAVQQVTPFFISDNCATSPDVQSIVLHNRVQRL